MEFGLKGTGWYLICDQVPKDGGEGASNLFYRLSVPVGSSQLRYEKVAQHEARRILTTQADLIKGYVAWITTL
ncbi:MAG: hypothetical protein WCV71_01035 [Patescibacteria group bacterium]